ncbi:hypothetical protein [Sulfitobacter donghicola]|uniref:Uncharacterized protein n=1 Tax=Sulfitobacter donghicola DSW-25 = KCTC 12864 = JCM 14565 TaxID=1300350 RepID=A0A073IES8_9RHOB|nr:hypothetical protein [Sulfitobacter donghicola]KEJ88873.1 hypothetical protein DSW25_13530 [Sulfitobacter donghicola DSW-25 = KCTC 12864 = JCM 14565]KIN68449.1 hypothetical protein Z948_2180 [Sulfitobacter donghicola DSW-25 = KCTC 12864 = JCM 14565]
MTNNDQYTEQTHPQDFELTRRAKIFHKMLEDLRESPESADWEKVVATAAASHFLYDAKARAAIPDVWEKPVAMTNLITLAKGNEPTGGTTKITEAAAQEMIFRAFEDPDYFDQVKLFCSHALGGEPMPYSDETTFTLHPLLSRWIGQVSNGGIKKPKTRKRQVLKSDIMHKAIANTVQFLHNAGIPIYKNDATEYSINACDAVAEISDTALGRRKIKGDAVKKIYYASEWGKLGKG